MGVAVCRVVGARGGCVEGMCGRVEGGAVSGWGGGGCGGVWVA